MHKFFKDEGEIIMGILGMGIWGNAGAGEMEMERPREAEKEREGNG